MQSVLSLCRQLVSTVCCFCSPLCFLNVSTGFCDRTLAYNCFQTDGWPVAAASWQPASQHWCCCWHHNPFLLSLAFLFSSACDAGRGALVQVHTHLNTHTHSPICPFAVKPIIPPLIIQRLEEENNRRSMEDNPGVWLKDSETRSDGFRKEQSSDLNDEAQPLIFNFYRNCDSWNGVLRFRRGKSILVLALISANCRHFSNFINYRRF